MAEPGIVGNGVDAGHWAWIGHGRIARRLTRLEIGMRFKLWKEEDLWFGIRSGAVTSSL